MSDAPTDPTPTLISPADGGPPLWGLNDLGFSSNDAPLFSADPWDTFWVSGFQLPGRCELRGAGACHDYESKKPKSKSGARLTVRGYKPMPFEVAVEIATVKQWSKLTELIDLFWTRLPGQVPAYQLAVTVSHPDLARLQIDRAILVGLPISEKGPVEGTRIFRFMFHEYFPIAQGPQAKTVKGAVPKEVGPQPAAAQLPGATPANAPPPPPSSDPANLGTGGPQSRRGQ